MLARISKLILTLLLAYPVWAAEPLAPAAAEPKPLAQPAENTTHAPATLVLGTPPKYPLQSEFTQFVEDSYDEQEDAQTVGWNLLQDYLVALRASSQEYLLDNVRPDADYVKLLYVKLMNEPDKHRGEVVKLRGIVRAMKTRLLDENPAGITRVWIGQISNAMGQISTFWSIEEPAPEIKKGKPVEICGIFMKRYAYLNDMPGDMLTWGPIIFIRHPTLLDNPPISGTSESMNSPQAIGAFVIISLALLGYLYFRMTSRPARKNPFTQAKLNRKMK